MRVILLLLLSLISWNTYAQEKNKIALIGTFHFHLVKSHFGVDFNLQEASKQQELNDITQSLSTYNPTKIFVEWDYTKQAELDTLFDLYLKDTTYSLIKNKYGKNESMYFDSEVQQLGFRLAKKLGHSKVYAFDFPLAEETDSMQNFIEKHNRRDIFDEITNEFKSFALNVGNKFQKTQSIKELLLFFNSNVIENQFNNGYITTFNKIGTEDNFSGAFYVSERYRRNLYMYSLIQKKINKENERILVIVGAQHAAGFREFIQNDKNIERVELPTILK